MTSTEKMQDQKLSHALRHLIDRLASTTGMSGIEVQPSMDCPENTLRIYIREDSGTRDLLNALARQKSTGIPRPIDIDADGIRSIVVDGALPDMASVRLLVEDDVFEQCVAAHRGRRKEHIGIGFQELLARCQQNVLPAMRPLRQPDEEFDPTGNHYYGRPWFNDGMTWPVDPDGSPLTFVMQIRLDTIPPVEDPQWPGEFTAIDNVGIILLFARANGRAEALWVHSDRGAVADLPPNYRNPRHPIPFAWSGPIDDYPDQTTLIVHGGIDGDCIDYMEAIDVPPGGVGDLRHWDSRASDKSVRRLIAAVEGTTGETIPEDLARRYLETRCHAGDKLHGHVNDVLIEDAIVDTGLAYVMTVDPADPIHADAQTFAAPIGLWISTDGSCCLMLTGGRDWCKEPYGERDMDEEERQLAAEMAAY